MMPAASNPGAGNTDAANADLAERVRAEQIRMVYLHSPTTSGGSLVAGAFLIAVLWDAVPHATLLTWGAALLEPWRVTDAAGALLPAWRHSRPVFQPRPAASRRTARAVGRGSA